MGFFSDYFCKLKIWAFFKINAANIEIDKYKTISKTTSTTQIFEPQDMLKCQILLEKKPNLIICYFLGSPLLFKLFDALDTPLLRTHQIDQQ